MDADGTLLLPAAGDWAALLAMGFSAPSATAHPEWLRASLPPCWTVVGGTGGADLVDDRGFVRVRLSGDPEVVVRRFTVVDIGPRLANLAIFEGPLEQTLPAEWPRLTIEERRKFVAFLYQDREPRLASPQDWHPEELIRLQSMLAHVNALPEDERRPLGPWLFHCPDRDLAGLLRLPLRAKGGVVVLDPGHLTAEERQAYLITVAMPPQLEALRLVDRPDENEDAMFALGRALSGVPQVGQATAAAAVAFANDLWESVFAAADFTEAPQTGP